MPRSRGEAKESTSQQVRATQDKALLPVMGHQALRRNPSYLVSEGAGKRWASPATPAEPTWVSRSSLSSTSQALPQQHLYSTMGKDNCWVQGTGRRNRLCFGTWSQSTSALTSRGENRQVNSTGVTSLYLLQGFLKQTKGAFMQIGRTCWSITSINRKCQIVFAEVFYCSVLFFLIFILWFHWNNRSLLLDRHKRS